MARRRKAGGLVADALKAVSKPHTIYKNAAGKRLPGVTTILSVLNKPALVAWANKLGLDGIDSSRYTDESARIGTLAHYLVQCHLTRTEPDLAMYGQWEIDKAENALISFYEWEKSHTIEPIETELPLISERFNFGGTIDCYCTMGGELWLLDFKTGKAIYTEMLYQLSAYRQLLIENGFPVDKAKIIRIGRSEDEGFEEKTITDFAPYFEVFEHCLAIYQLQKRIGGK